MKYITNVPKVPLWTPGWSPWAKGSYCWLASWYRIFSADDNHRNMTPKFVTPTTPSRIDNSGRSTTLSPAKKLTSSTANLEWCHVHFIRDSYSTFIHQVIGPSKNSMKLFFNAKFDFKSTWNRDSTTSHHKHPVSQSPAGEAEKLTQNSTLNPHEILTRLPLTISIRFLSPLPGRRRN